MSKVQDAGIGLISAHVGESVRPYYSSTSAACVALSHIVGEVVVRKASVYTLAGVHVGNLVPIEVAMAFYGASNDNGN